MSVISSFHYSSLITQNTGIAISNECANESGCMLYPLEKPGVLVIIEPRSGLLEDILIHIIPPAGPWRRVPPSRLKSVRKLSILYPLTVKLFDRLFAG